MIKTLIILLGKWLHGITGEQWQHVFDLVKAAESSFAAGASKLAWVKAQIAEFIKSDRGKVVLGGLSNRAMNWLIETAVSFLRK